MSDQSTYQSSPLCRHSQRTHAQRLQIFPLNRSQPVKEMSMWGIMLLMVSVIEHHVSVIITFLINFISPSLECDSHQPPKNIDHVNTQEDAPNFKILVKSQSLATLGS